MIDIEDDHLCGATGLASGLDGAGRCIGATHEAHGTGSGAAALEEFLGGTNARKVDTCARATLEDGAFLDVPVEDGVHLVVDRQDETGRCLLRDAFNTDVEPHRRVERCTLGDDDELQFCAERFGLFVGDEVAVTDAPVGDRVGNTIGDLLERPFALIGVGGAAEVLLSDDVGGVERPSKRELDAELLESNLAGLPVGDASVATFPLDLVKRVGVGVCVVPTDADAGLFRCQGHEKSSA